MIMDINAEAKYIRISPRKVRLVVDAVKDLPPGEALTQLNFLSKGAARPVAKVLKSAIADATHNFNIDAARLPS